MLTPLRYTGEQNEPSLAGSSMIGTAIWGALAIAVPFVLLAGIGKAVPQIRPHFARRLAGTRPRDVVIAGGIVAAIGAAAIWFDARVSAQRWAMIGEVLGLPAGLETARYRQTSKSQLALPRGASHATLTERQVSDLLAQIADGTAPMPGIQDFNGRAVAGISADALRWQSFEQLKDDTAQRVPWMRLTADPVRMLAGSRVVCIAFVSHDSKTGGGSAADKRLHAKACRDRAPRETYEFIVMAALVPVTRTLHVAVL